MFWSYFFIDVNILITLIELFNTCELLDIRNLVAVLDLFFRDIFIDRRCQHRLLRIFVVSVFGIVLRFRITVLVLFLYSSLPLRVFMESVILHLK